MTFAIESSRIASCPASSEALASACGVEAARPQPIRIMPGQSPQVHRTTTLPSIGPSHIGAIPDMLGARRMGWVHEVIVLSISWLIPHFADEEGRLKMSIDVLVVEAITSLLVV
jgi:hypothetical protein